MEESASISTVASGGARREQSRPVGRRLAIEASSSTPIPVPDHGAEVSPRSARTVALPLIRGQAELHGQSRQDRAGEPSRSATASALAPATLAGLALQGPGRLLFRLLMESCRAAPDLVSGMLRASGHARDAIVRAVSGRGPSRHADLPDDIWHDIIDLLPPGSLHDLSRVSEGFRRLVLMRHGQALGAEHAQRGVDVEAGTGRDAAGIPLVVIQSSLALLIYATLSLLAGGPLPATDPRPPVPSRSRLSRTVLLLGSPPDALGRGGSGILGLRPALREPLLAALRGGVEASGQDRRLTVCLNALRQDPDAPVEPGDRVVGTPLGFLRVLLRGLVPRAEIVTLCDGTAGASPTHAALAVALCEMASRVATMDDLRGVVGRRPDEDGYGGVGILSLPTDLQRYPLRLLNHRMATDRPALLDPASIVSTLAGPTVASGDALALRCLCDPGHWGVGTRDADSRTIDALRTVWAAACSPPHARHAASMKALLRLLPIFPAGECAERFDQVLSAWETVVEEDATRFAESPPTRSRWDLGGWSGVDEALTWALRAAVPADFHAQGERRISSLCKRIDAARLD